MMMRHFIFLCALLLSGCARSSEQYAHRDIDIQSGSMPIILHVEEAQTPAQLTLGLSGRAGLQQNEGMLFVFAGDGLWPFWMIKMRFSIDMIWLDKNCRIVHIERAAPPCPATADSESSCPVYRPPMPARYVLETAAHFADKYALKPHDILAVADHCPHKF